VIVFGVIAIVFINYAKSSADAVQDYKQLFNNTGEIGIALIVFVKTLGNVFAFKAESYLVSIYAYLIILGIPISIYLSKPNENKDKYGNTLLLFFLFFGILNLIVLIVSHWVFLNDFGRRYYSISYVSLAIAVLLYFDLSVAKYKKLRIIILSVIVICGSLSSIRYFYYPQRIPPHYNQIKEFDKLGKAGIISGYWNSYINACVSPHLIKATPHDLSNVRNRKLIEDVFQQPKLYVLKVYWMEQYPDTMVQFNKTLVKKGEGFPIAGMDICEYEVIEP